MSNYLCLRDLTSALSKLLNMLATPKFWYIVIALVGAIILLVNCLKHPKVGKWVLFGLFYLGYLCLSIYSIVQVSLFYKARGGIFGQITGIFKTNQVEIVDNITYKLTNTELVQVGQTDTYRASALVSEILDLSKDVEYQMLVNNVPCNTKNESDYVVAEYDYVFYDENFDILKRDVLSIRVAFYADSTMFILSTDGGSEAVKYWNYYFNKNDFVINLSAKINNPQDDKYSSGDVSNFVKITYKNKDEIYSVKIIPQGSSVDLSTPTNIDKFEYWTFDGAKIESLIADSDLEIVAYTTPIYDCNFYVDNEIVKSTTLNKGEKLESFTPVKTIASGKWVFDYWLVGKDKVTDLTTYVVNSDLDFVAIGHVEYYIIVRCNEDEIFKEFRIENSSLSDISSAIPSNFVVESWTASETINGIYRTVDLNNLKVNSNLIIRADGYYNYSVKFFVNNQLLNSSTIKQGENCTIPDNPTVANKIFVGWSLDGHNVVKDNEFSNIQQDKNFYAVFNDVLYTLQVKDSYNGEVVTSVQQANNTTFFLTQPSKEGFTFYGWKIASGNGSITDNVFTFVGSDCEIYPIYNELQSFKCVVPIKFDATYYDANGNQLTSPFNLACTDYIKITFNRSDFIFDSDTDGQIKITKLDSYNVVIQWTEATYVKLDFYKADYA